MVKIPDEFENLMLIHFHKYESILNSKKVSFENYMGAFRLYYNMSFIGYNQDMCLHFNDMLCKVDVDTNDADKIEIVSKCKRILISNKDSHVREIQVTKKKNIGVLRYYLDIDNVFLFKIKLESTI